ncbi:TetR/AcrR family transcriptional regulator [Henriciella sp.]|uniref:TetR/AcrR family transcriptional regulator n=1 Tax=Henriciella sp. TaxID=1968823 RepID=UPI0026190E1C|nr:TetR/AcrR family transcriptional regulator [Henriciella sp.]
MAAASRLLEEKPGTAVRMSDIAKASGVSRQAVYLHFPTRADLLIATARHLDQVLNVDEQLAASRAATSGRERLDAYIDAWGNYIPQIYGVARAFLAMEATDEAAAAAWKDRMDAMRHGCEAAVRALAEDGDLKPGFDQEKATDLLWTLLSVRTWEHLVQDCGWSQQAYVEAMKYMAETALVA